jgi:hypothetical protein
MVEVRNLNDNEVAPTASAWVLIQKRGDHFSVRGVAKGEAIDASFEPHGLDSAEKAIKASVVWADLLEIPVIYVRDHVRPEA